jgi:glycogen operon protein
MIYVAINMYWDGLRFELPDLPPELRWHVAVNTSMPSPYDISPAGEEVLLSDQHEVIVGGRSIVVLVGK